MAETRIRFRTDSWHWADQIASGFGVKEFREWGYKDDQITEILKLERAQPGDVWRIRWHKEGGDGPLAGYAICCSTCKKVHTWTTATNCATKRQVPCGKDASGNELLSWVCVHSGTGSCWQWSGMPEDGTLTASPSLWCQAERGGCGFHGWLQNGLLKG